MSISTACANIALVKYWGKRDAGLNTPAAGSLSLTLDRLRTWTEVRRVEGAPSDTLAIDGQPVAGKGLDRISRFADLVRARAGTEDRIHVESRNTFPTAAGLASSASAFAALAVAVADAFGVKMTETELSILARRGSGSAARSIFGGYARMHAGKASDGSDAYAEAMNVNVPLSAAICVAKAEAKKIGSTDGMELTRTTSPYHDAWIRLVDDDLARAEAALQKADLSVLAEIVEGNCLAMHANAMSARPGIIYFRASTLWAIEQVRTLRSEGTPVFFTIDAGPHVVAFTPPEHLETVAGKLSGHPEVAEVLTSTVGEGAHLVDAFPETL